MFRNLLVPLDGSEFAEQALPLAVSIAKEAGATLHLMRVVPLPATVYVETWPAMENVYDPGAVEAAHCYLENTAARIRNVADVPVETTVLTGGVVEVLEERAAGMKADLVVLTTHGRGPLSRFWFGSVADELIRRLPMPLLVVRPQNTSPSLEELPSLKRILIPLDGSPLAERILEPAQTLGRLWKADYTLFRVVHPVTVAALEPVNYSIAAVDNEALDEAKRKALDYLEALAVPARAEAFGVRTRVGVREQPALAILEEAERQEVDAIAIETHGRRGLARLFLGSVADKVVRGATVPVLIHRGSEK
jgi:nucleotide-binding universal stress UspA family protein